MAFDALRLVLQNVWFKVGVGPMVDKMGVMVEMTFWFQVCWQKQKNSLLSFYNCTIIANSRLDLVILFLIFHTFGTQE